MREQLFPQGQLFEGKVGFRDKKDFEVLVFFNFQIMIRKNVNVNLPLAYVAMSTKLDGVLYGFISKFYVDPKNVSQKFLNRSPLIFFSRFFPLVTQGRF